MLGYIGSLGLTNKLNHQMNMAKCEIIMVNLTKGQIKMVNLTNPIHSIWPI